MTLTLQQANTIIEGAFMAAKEMKINPLGVVVLDASGHVVASQRQDKASVLPARRRLGQGLRRGRHGRIEPGAVEAIEG